MLQFCSLPAAQSDLVASWPCYQYMYIWTFINHIASQSRAIKHTGQCHSIGLTGLSRLNSKQQTNLAVQGFCLCVLN